MSAYDELYHLLVTRSGISPLKRYEYNGYYLTVEQYIRSCVERGGSHYIVNSMIVNKIPPDQTTNFLEGAITRIIVHTLGGHPNYATYYKDKIQKIN